MAIADLEVPSSDKDTSKSCIFDFPDRPPDTLPPDPPPPTPPLCFPYCPGDDWPPIVPPVPPLPPGVIPPGIDPIGLGPTVTLDINPLGRNIEYFVFEGREGLLTNQAHPTLVVSLELRGDGSTLLSDTIADAPPDAVEVLNYIGAGATELNYLFKTHSLTSNDPNHKGRFKKYISTPNFIAKLIFLFPTVDLFEIGVVNTDSGLLVAGSPGGSANIVNTNITIGGNDAQDRFDLDDSSYIIGNSTVGHQVAIAGFTCFVWYYKPTGQIYVDSDPHTIVGNTSPNIFAASI